MPLQKGALLLTLTALLAGCAAVPVPQPLPTQATLAAPAAPEAKPRESEQVPGRLTFLRTDRVIILEAGERQTRNLPAGISAATISPDGRQLAGLLNGEIILLDLATSQQTAMSKTEARHLSWSPTGDRLASHTERDGQTILELHATAGGEVQRVTIPATGRANLTWVPDGSRLVAQIGPETLWLVDLNQSTATRIAESAHAPAWSPDGSSLAYAQADRVILWREGETPLVAMREEALAAAYPSQAELFDKNQLQLTTLTWSPTGSRLVAAGKAAGPAPRFVLASALAEGCVADLWVLPLHLDKQPKRNGVTQWPPRPCHPGSYTWVRGGKQIAITLNGPGCDGTLALLDAESLAPVVEINAPAGQLIASPDGTWVALTTETGTTLIDLAHPDDKVQLDGLGRLVHWSHP